MSNTVVTLSGDDANLFKAYQRIIAQQAKMDAGLKGIGDQAKKTKTGLDALASTDFDDLNDSMEDLGDTSAIAEGITTSTFFKMASAVNLSQLAVDGLISSVQSSIDHFKELQRIGEQSLERTERTAAGQQEAAKNLVSLTPDEFRDVQERVVPQIQRDTGFTDRGLLSRAYGEVRSILPQNQTEELLATSARLNRLTPDNLVETATSIADIVRNLKVTIPEAVGMLASAQTVFRAPEQRMVARGIADVSSMAINTSTAKVPITEIADQATALLSVLGKDDAEGRSSVTGTLSFMGQLRDPFTEKARTERDKRFEQLTRDRDLEIENQRKLELDIAKADVTAKQFSPTDTTPQAAIARNAAAKARRDLERSRADLKKNEDELARISRLQAVQMTDPGTPLGRLDAITANPDLRKEVTTNLQGELAYRDEMEALLTPNSELRKMLESNREAISTDPKQAERLMGLLSATPQQQQASLVQTGQLQTAAFDDANPGLAASARMRQLRDEAISRRNVTMTPDYYIESFFNGLTGGTLGSMLEANAVGTDPVATADSTIMQLKDVRNRIASTTDPKAIEYSKFLDQQIAAINQQLDLYQETIKTSATVPTAKPLAPVPQPVAGQPVDTMPTPQPATTDPVRPTEIQQPAIDTNVVTMPPPVPVSSLTQPTTSLTETPVIDTNIVPTMPPTAPVVNERPQLNQSEASSQQTQVRENADSQTQIELLRKQNELMEENNRLLKESAKPQQPAPIPPPNPASINLQQTLRSQ
jgi:hypothetical protein